MKHQEGQEEMKLLFNGIKISEQTNLHYFDGEMA